MYRSDRALEGGLVPFHLSTQFQHPELARFSRQQWRAWAARSWTLIQLLGAMPQLDYPVQEAVFSLMIVDEPTSQQMNAEYRGKDYPTNVITFELGVAPNGHLMGDLVICQAVLDKEATAQGIDPAFHARHLLLHGLLHALGYDHIEDDEAETMEGWEIQILQAQGLPNPYVDKTI